MGGRICSMVAADDDDPIPALASHCSATRSIRPENRTPCGWTTSSNSTMPVLFVSGTRDAFGTPAELKRHAKKA